MGRPKKQQLIDIHYWSAKNMLKLDCLLLVAAPFAPCCYAIEYYYVVHQVCLQAMRKMLIEK